MNDEQKTEIINLTNRMVHDVRTPITIFNMLHSSWGSKLPDTEECREELAILKEESQKIDTIVSQYREKLKNML